MLAALGTFCTNLEVELRIACYCRIAGVGLKRQQADVRRRNLVLTADQIASGQSYAVIIQRAVAGQRGDLDALQRIVVCVLEWEVVSREGVNLAFGHVQGFIG